MSASGMREGERGERRKRYSDGGCMRRGGTARRTSQRAGWSGSICSSRNNVNVEQAGDRCFVQRDSR